MSSLKSTPKANDNLTESHVYKTRTRAANRIIVLNITVIGKAISFELFIPKKFKNGFIYAFCIIISGSNNTPKKGNIAPILKISAKEDRTNKTINHLNFNFLALLICCQTL